MDASKLAEMASVEANIGSWDKVVDKFSDAALEAGIRIIIAIIIYLVGKFLISKLVKGLKRLKSMKSVDPTAENYLITAVRAVLYMLLIVSIIALLGVPMSSVIAVIASAGVAIGLALQGALANIAGGIMLLLFRPFSVGDYISTGSEQGTVKSISLVYTVLTTVDNRRISVPNGNLMNASISNASAEPLRRVDISFDTDGSVASDSVTDLLEDVTKNIAGILANPETQILPTELIPGGIRYQIRAWTKTEDYWDVYNSLMKEVPASLNAAGIKRPAAPVRLLTDDK